MSKLKTTFATLHNTLSVIQTGVTTYALGRTLGLLPSEKVNKQLSLATNFLKAKGTGNIVEFLSNDTNHYVDGNAQGYYPNWNGLNHKIDNAKCSVFSQDFLKNSPYNGALSAGELMFSKSIFGQTTHFALVPFAAAVIDRDVNDSNSMELIGSFAAIGVIELGYWLTKDSDDHNEV